MAEDTQINVFIMYMHSVVLKGHGKLVLIQERFLNQTVVESPITIGTTLVQLRCITQCWVRFNSLICFASGSFVNGSSVQLFVAKQHGNRLENVLLNAGTEILPAYIFLFNVEYHQLLVEIIEINHQIGSTQTNQLD